ncbi:MAG: serine/threonine-protein phosphatase [Betaproteobacteria bacterium]|nr:serine/threonine-protein phosphatase [Betaproteobacteria bacterium]
MRFTIFRDSRQGDRSGNEDRIGYSYGKDVLLMVVADGMGGHLQGEVAAEIAVTEITRLFQQEARNRLRRPSDFLVSVINAAHRAIVSHAVAENLLESPRTTCVVCIVQGGTAWWAHSGDSRLYVLRGGKLVAATQDHSRVQQLVDSGVITPEAAATHPERNKIFSCLGGVVPPVIAVGSEFALQTGDTILLSSDGFWSQIPAALIANLLRKQDIVGLLPGLLTEAYKRAKGESDNLSIVAMTWEAQDDPRYADTEQVDAEHFTTSSNTLDPDRSPAADDVTDDEIEKAIAEIQSAIKKVPR